MRKASPLSRNKPQSGLMDLFADPAPAVLSPVPPSSLTTLTAPAELGRCSVDDLVERLDRVLTRHMGIVRVEGEISGFTPAASGHWYFNLKGANHLIKCVMFRPQTLAVQTKPTQGLQVEITAIVGLYRPRGELQLQVKSMKPAGLGALYAAFAALREKLSAEGLFAAERKKPLPLYPRRVGIITSTATAALQDVLKIMREHSPHINVVVYPALVQGNAAPADLQRALRAAIRHGFADVLLIVRGGGSMEDLFCFNDEALLRDIAACPIPTLSGVGHETDTTLIDYVVDARAPTPTAAAHCLPATAALNATLIEAKITMQEAFQRLYRTHQQRLDLSWRLLRSLRESLGGARLETMRGALKQAWRRRVQRDQEHLERQGLILRPLMSNRLKQAQNHLQQWGNLLKAYDPASPQKKGYALIKRETQQGEVWVNAVTDLQVSDKIHVSFGDGEVYANVLAVHTK